MKKLLLFIVLSCLAVLGNAQSNLVFKELFYDFGHIDGIKDIEHKFIFRNAGKFPIKIRKINTDCACLSSAYSMKSISPNKYDTLIVKYSPYRAGNFTKKITVLTDGKPNAYELKIKGFIEPNSAYKARLFKHKKGVLRFKHKYLNFGTIAHHTPVSRKFEVYNPSTEPVIFTDHIISPKHIGLFFDSTHIIPPKESRFLVITYDPKIQKQHGYLQESIIMHTKNAENPSVPMTVSIHLLPKKKKKKSRKKPAHASKTGSPKISLSERQQNLGTIYPKMTVSTEFEVYNKGTKPLIIKNIGNTKNCIIKTGIKQPIPAGETRIIQVQVQQFVKQGEQKSYFTIFSNDPTSPELEGEIIVKVVSEE